MKQKPWRMIRIPRLKIRPNRRLLTIVRLIIFETDDLVAPGYFGAAAPCRGIAPPRAALTPTPEQANAGRAHPGTELDAPRPASDALPANNQSRRRGDRRSRHCRRNKRDGCWRLPNRSTASCCRTSTDSPRPNSPSRGRNRNRASPKRGYTHKARVAPRMGIHRRRRTARKPPPERAPERRQHKLRTGCVSSKPRLSGPARSLLIWKRCAGLVRRATRLWSTSDLLRSRGGYPRPNLCLPTLRQRGVGEGGYPHLLSSKRPTQARPHL